MLGWKKVGPPNRPLVLWTCKQSINALILHKVQVDTTPAHVLVVRAFASQSVDQG